MDETLKTQRPSANTSRTMRVSELPKASAVGDATIRPSSGKASSNATGGDVE